MKNFLFFKAFYEGKVHYMCDFFKSISDDVVSYEINIEAGGQHIVCHVSKNAKNTWKITGETSQLNDTVQAKLLEIINAGKN